MSKGILLRSAGVLGMAGGIEHQRVAIGRALGHQVAADRAAGAAAVVDHHRLAEPARQGGRDDARHRVDRAAGRVGHDQPDRAAGPALGLGWGLHRQRCEQQDGAGPGQAAPARDVIGHEGLLSFEFEEPGRRVDQDPLPGGGVGHPVGERRLGGRVVDPFAMLGVGPVAAPQQAPGAEGAQQPIGRRAGLRRRGHWPVAVGGRELDPGPAAGGRGQQPGLAGVGQRTGAAEMVHHQLAAGIEHGLSGLGQRRRVAMQLDMPVERAHAREQALPGRA